MASDLEEVLFEKIKKAFAILKNIPDVHNDVY
jgi:hypothetical protein